MCWRWTTPWRRFGSRCWTLARLGDIARKVRSKNAGPFWLTVDIFCDDAAAFNAVVQGVRTQAVAALFAADPATLRRFDIPSLHVVKFSLPRPAPQGAPDDRDLHGASWAALVEALDIPPPNEIPSQNG